MRPISWSEILRTTVSCSDHRNRDRCTLELRPFPMSDSSGRAPGGAKPGTETQERLRSALRKAQAAPDDDQLWNEVEKLAAELGKPDEVEAQYRRVLKGKLSSEAASRVGQ